MLKYADVSEKRALELLKTRASGLNREEARARLEKSGFNRLEEGKKTSVIGLFLSQFGDVMTLMLIAAAVISAVVAYFSGDISDITDTAIIIGIILLNAAVGTVQQYRADKAIEGLKKMNSATAKVRREGEILIVPAEELVEGDIVLLEEGDVVPADMRILKATSLRCDEAALTGESHGVEKREGVIDGKKVTVVGAYNLLFSSTFVVGGSAEAVVTATGRDTEIGGIANMLEGVRKGGTPLEKSLNKLGKIISAFVLAVAAVLFCLGAFARNAGVLKSFMTAVAVAVAAIPEGLPAVISVIMAMGVQRMSRENVVIRKLKSVETLGSCTCICTDKTGTLTRNQMKVAEVFDCENKDDKIIECMSICTRVKKGESGYLGDPTEVALKVYADEKGFNEEYCVIGEIPFSSERKLMSVQAETQRGTFVFVKGAAEEVLKRCTSFRSPQREISQKDKDEILAKSDELSRGALRVLAFAYKESKELTEEGLTFIGLCGMIDGLKEGVSEAVEEVRQAGITTVMITGDSAATAFAIAKKAGIADSESQVFTGEQLDNMTRPQLRSAVKCGRVFARVSPKHKNIIVRLKQANGEVVAMTGDGVNDAPSVKSADIGIAMGKNGTEVTKSVADMVIADDNFTTIVAAVREGRRISSNVKKTIQFFLSTNLAEVLAILFATIMFFNCEFLPSTQLLWINLITDSFPVLALGVERGDFGAMKRPPERTEKAIFSRSSLFAVGVSAAYITLITVLTFALALRFFGNETATTMTFLTLSFAELFHVFNVRSERRSAFGKSLFSNKTLLVTVALGIAVNVALCFSPLAAAFGICRLNAWQWLAVFAASLSVIPFGELYKLAFKLAKKDKRSVTLSRAEALPQS